MDRERNPFLEVALSASQEASDYIREQSKLTRQIDFKGTTDLVTQADHGSEDIILRQIEAAYPEHSILAEESDGKRLKSQFTWIIDPLDGTTNFVHGYPFYAVSIALFKDESPLIGVVSDVFHEQIYSAVLGEGAYCNGEKISVTGTSKLQKALLATGFPYIHDEIWHRNMELFRQFTDRCQGVRRAGAAALDLCHVACGWLDGFWEHGLQPWDSAAGMLIVEEAGGKITRNDGSQFSIFYDNIVASNGILHEEMLAVINC